jgi:hypothetical protein
VFNVPEGGKCLTGIGRKCWQNFYFNNT